MPSLLCSQPQTAAQKQGPGCKLALQQLRLWQQASWLAATAAGSQQQQQVLSVAVCVVLVGSCCSPSHQTGSWQLRPSEPSHQAAPAAGVASQQPQHPPVTWQVLLLLVLPLDASKDIPKVQQPPRRLVCVRVLPLRAAV